MLQPHSLFPELFHQCFMYSAHLYPSASIILMSELLASRSVKPNSQNENYNLCYSNCAPFLLLPSSSTSQAVPQALLIPLCQNNELNQVDKKEHFPFHPKLRVFLRSSSKTCSFSLPLVRNCMLATFTALSHMNIHLKSGRTLLCVSAVCTNTYSDT